MKTSHTPICLLSLLACSLALSACGEGPSDLGSSAGAEAGLSSETGDAGLDSEAEAETEAGDGAPESESESGNASGSTTESGETESGADEPEDPATRITDLWTEPEGLYVRALPGDTLMQRIPDVAEVMAFFPSAEQREIDDGVFTSLLDAEGETLMAVKLWNTEALPNGTALNDGLTIAMFSDWMDDLPLTLCVTEPCPFDDWPEANRIVQGSIGDQFHVDGVMRGERFSASYANTSTEAVILEEKGFDLLDGDELQELKRAELVALDLSELSIELHDSPAVPTSGDFDPCEALENAAQGAASAAGAACCVETGFFGCFACFAAAQTVVEELEDICN